MSGSGKQSFYEIQLSNASLIAAFLVAVVIGVAVFMLGVMVGRQQAPAPAAASELVESLPPVQPAGQSEDTASSDLDFYSQVQEPTETQGTEAAPAPQHKPASEPSAPPQTASGTASALPQYDPSLASGFVVQVKSTPNEEEAKSLQAALADAGFPAWVVSGDVRGRTFYRVRVGRYRNRADAERVAEALGRRNDVTETWVTEG